MNNSFYKHNYLSNNSKDIIFSPNNSKRSQINNKLSFKTLKCNTCQSLNDVEYFLCNFSTFLKYIKLYNLLK